MERALKSGRTREGLGISSSGGFRLLLDSKVIHGIRRETSSSVEGGFDASFPASKFRREGERSLCSSGLSKMPDFSNEERSMSPEEEEKNETLAILLRRRG